MLQPWMLHAKTAAQMLTRRVRINDVYSDRCLDPSCGAVFQCCASSQTAVMGTPPPLDMLPSKAEFCPVQDSTMTPSLHYNLVTALAQTRCWGH